MNEIPDLKYDYAFLKKFDSHNKIWKEIDGKKEGGKSRVRSNFLLHPKRLISDSDCSSVVNTPRKFLSSTVIKNSSFLDEPNNNVRRKVTKMTAKVRVNDDLYLGRGDNGTVKNSEVFNVKNLMGDSNFSGTVTKKSSRVRPSTESYSNFDKKFRNFVEKSVKLLNDIRETINKGIDPPDGEEDCLRRMKRLQEFSARFSRTYLYPLLRQMDELSMPDKLGANVLNQKVLYAHQVVLQGLQAYYNHLPSSVGKCCSDKLKSLLDQTLYLCQLHGLLKKEDASYGENDEFINALRSHTELLVEAINNFDLKFVEKIKESSKKKVSKPMNKAKSKLSMYTVSVRKDSDWRKAADNLAKKKFNVKSKYKTACFKHRPPVEKPNIVSLPSKVKLFPRRSSGILKNTPAESPIREEDIKTMVEMEGDLEAPPNTGEPLNHENSTASSGQQLVRDSDRDETEVKKALDVLKRFLTQDQDGVLERIAGEVDRRNDKTKSKKKTKEPIVTVSGAKNAKLICIRDENSVDEEEEEARAEIKLVSSETQTELKDHKKRTNSGSAVKISRLPKANRRMLVLLPKNYAINIIQYKLRYCHFHKKNPMYRKCANLQPWVLMGRISDDILDHVLESVAGELEVNEILENLYNAEFQY